MGNNGIAEERLDVFADLLRREERCESTVEKYYSEMLLFCCGWTVALLIRSRQSSVGYAECEVTILKLQKRLFW